MFKKVWLGALAVGSLLLAPGAVAAHGDPDVVPAEMIFVSEEDPNLVPIQASTFLKPELVVTVGSTVTWLNLDGEGHNVVERFNLLFESPIMGTGEAFALTFYTPGVYAYVCDLHANQEGVVVVVDPTTM